MNQRLAATRQTDHQRPVSQPMNAPLPAGSLVHPLLRLQHTTGNQAVQRLVKSRRVQTKVRISHPGDIYEQEADRVAQEVMRMPEPGLQRACAPCAGGGSPCSKCEGEKEKLVQRKVDPAGSDVSPLVHNSLQSAGQPLDEATRAFFEPRFGSSLGHVRVHTGPEAGESARSLGALAYTVGSDIVFVPGAYAPGTPSGRLLLAHELVHTMQQGGADHVRRFPFVPCAQANLSAQDCPPREKDEVAQSETTSMALLELTPPANGYVVVNFAVGSSVVKKSLKDLLYWKQVVELMKKPNVRWSILGLSDCAGPEKLNEDLRKARADAIYNILPDDARKQVVSHKGASLLDCITANLSRPDRTMNRSVVIEEVERVVDVKPEKVEGHPPKFVCGPDVTREIANAVRLARSIFKGWNSSQREEACDALISFSVGSCAWDIVELHNNNWINKDFRPACASSGAQPPCGESVQVDNDCHHAGAANYVIFGTMFKLCSDEDPNTFFAFSESNMKALIDIYKGSGISGVRTPSKNFKSSMKWAIAGYHGWPSGVSSPSGDWNHCVPMCPLSYSGPSFKIHWYPHEANEVCS